MNAPGVYSKQYGVGFKLYELELYIIFYIWYFGKKKSGRVW